MNVVIIKCDVEGHAKDRRFLGIENVVSLMCRDHSTTPPPPPSEVQIVLQLVRGGLCKAPCTAMVVLHKLAGQDLKSRFLIFKGGNI